MAAEVTLDFTNPSKKKKRTRVRRDTAVWHKRYGVFLDYGFSDKEARWGADNKLVPELNKRLLEACEKRLGTVKWFMKKYSLTWNEAVARAAADLEERLQHLGMKEKNLFYEVDL